MGLFKRSRKDKCFPYGKEKVNGSKPESFPEHDLRPVREDHISRLGAHLDWVKECSRCGYEDLGLGNMTSYYGQVHSQTTRRLDEVDALVQTFPFFFGPLRIQEGPQDNCCTVSKQKNGWHSTREYNLRTLVNKELIAEYKTEYLSDSSHYAWDDLKPKMVKGRVEKWVTSTVGNGLICVWECTYCKQLVKEYLDLGVPNNDGYWDHKRWYDDDGSNDTGGDY
tara:strand:+ start:2149 stop:2817 length:669 start_codon:yes stop_codon:yes gene_type:complete